MKKSIRKLIACTLLSALVLMCCPPGLLAQSVFNENHPMFDMVDVPEKWQGESAVVIAYQTSSTYNREDVYIYWNEQSRKRIKLQDESAVEDYSQFYFVDGYTIDIKIIKPNGDEVEVDISDAIEVKSTTAIPSLFQTYYQNSSLYSKLAIPNLEVGDIIDYKMKKKESIFPTGSTFSFAPYSFTLGGKYPIMKQRFHFEVDRQFRINFNSFNGAPEIMEMGSGYDRKGKLDEYIKAYVLEDSDREKVEDMRWYYHRKTEAGVKFIVHYVQGNKAGHRYVGERGVVKSSVAPKEVMVGLSEFSTSWFSEDNIRISKYMRSKYDGPQDQTSMVKAVYYYYRNLFIRDYYMAEYNELLHDRHQQVTINHIRFVRTLEKIFERLEIPCEYGAYIPRSLGDLDNLLLEYEPDYFMRVKGTQEMLLFPFTNFTTIDDIPSGAENVRAIVATPQYNFKHLTADIITLPSTSSADNGIDYTIEAKLAEDLKTLSVDRRMAIKGGLKRSYSGLITYNTNYQEAEALKYDPKFEPYVPLYRQ